MRLIVLLAACFPILAHADVWVTIPAFTYHQARTQGNGDPWNENQHKAGPGESKKCAVRAKENGKFALVGFGDPDMAIKKHHP